MTIGDVNSDARGAGARFNEGKREFHQLPLFSLEGVLKVLEYGAKKYAPGNWLKGQPWLVPFDSMMRHMAAWQRGEELDPESGLPHLDHALCNLIFLSAYRDVFPEGDNRWPAMQKGGVKLKETADNVDRRESEEHRGQPQGTDAGRATEPRAEGCSEFGGEDFTVYATEQWGKRAGPDGAQPKPRAYRIRGLPSEAEGASAEGSPGEFPTG